MAKSLLGAAGVVAVAAVIAAVVYASTDDSDSDPPMPTGAPPSYEQLAGTGVCRSVKAKSWRGYVPLRDGQGVRLVWTHSSSERVCGVMVEGSVLTLYVSNPSLVNGDLRLDCIELRRDLASSTGSLQDGRTGKTYEPDVPTGEFSEQLRPLLGSRGHDCRRFEPA